MSRGRRASTPRPGSARAPGPAPSTNRAYGTISNLRAKGVDIGEIYETPKPAWWRQAYEYVGSFFRRAPAPKRKREDDDDDVVDLTV